MVLLCLSVIIFSHKIASASRASITERTHSKRSEIQENVTFLETIFTNRTLKNHKISVPRVLTCCVKLPEKLRSSNKYVWMRQEYPYYHRLEQEFRPDGTSRDIWGGLDSKRYLVSTMWYLKITKTQLVTRKIIRLLQNLHRWCYFVCSFFWHDQKKFLLKQLRIFAWTCEKNAFQCEIS
jgi:hypothetical protein